MRKLLIILFIVFTATSVSAQFGSTPFPDNLIIYDDGDRVLGRGKTIDVREHMNVTYDSVGVRYHLGVSEDSLDAVFLRLDATNDPITASLEIEGAVTAESLTILDVGDLAASPIAGTFEFDDNRMYVTNVDTQKAIDRTDDVTLDTITVADTTTETTIWTGNMEADSLVAANVFKLHTDGLITNASAGGVDQITMRVKVGGVTKATLTPITKKFTNTGWHLDANATQRTIGGAGMRAIHLDLVIGDDNTMVVGVAAIDTTINMDVTVTAQWASAKAGNTISMYQGFMEYKN